MLGSMNQDMKVETIQIKSELSKKKKNSFIFSVYLLKIEHLCKSLNTISYFEKMNEIINFFRKTLTSLVMGKFVSFFYV